MKKLIRGEFIFYAMVVGLCFVNWKATLVVFIIPFLLSRFVMMLGNWTQHAFIDPEHPDNLYRSSITCINVKYNHKCWNDGYHISHHIKPAMHWTEHPHHFLTNLDEYAKQKAIIFDGFDFLKVFYYLMRKKYDVLATRVVNLNDNFKSDEEIIELMKSRTKRFKKAV